MSQRVRVKQRVKSQQETETREIARQETAAVTPSQSTSAARLSTADLTSVVRQRYSLTRADAAHVITQISDRLVKALQDGEAVGFIRRLEGDQVELRILSIEDIAAESHHGEA